MRYNSMCITYICMLGSIYFEVTLEQIYGYHISAEHYVKILIVLNHFTPTSFKSRTRIRWSPPLTIEPDYIYFSRCLCSYTIF